MVQKATGLLGILILILMAVACGKSTAEKWQEQYDLGQQYLLEENYEEAIVAFTAAIELDPKQANAYIGRGDAYFAWAEKESSSEKYQSAMSDYEAAERLREQAETAAKIEETDSRLSELESGLKQWKAEMTEEEESIVQNAITALESNDNQSINDALIHSGLTDIIEKYGYDSWNGSRKLMDYGDTLNGTGATFEIWYENMVETLSVLYGTWKDGMANGNALYVSILYGIEDESIHVFRKAVGNWVDGSANGSFMYEQTSLGGGQGGHITTVSGSVKDGFWEGEVKETGLTDINGNDVTVFSTFVNGRAEKKGDYVYGDGTTSPLYGVDESGNLSIYAVGDYNELMADDGIQLNFMMTEYSGTEREKLLNASLSFYIAQKDNYSQLMR